MKSSKHDTLYRIRVRNNITGQTATVPDAPTNDVERLRRRLAELNEHNTTCEYWLEPVEPGPAAQIPAPPVFTWGGLALWTLAFAALWGIIGCLCLGDVGAMAGAAVGAIGGAAMCCLFAAGDDPGEDEADADEGDTTNTNREERKTA